MICYREGILNFNVITYKNASGAYVLSTIYSKFRNNFVRDNATEIYDFKWNILGISGGSPSKDSEFRLQMGRQSELKEIVIEQDNVTDSTGRYDLAI